MAFFLDTGATAFSKQEEEDGIRFSVENATEDIVNGLFCTYEPPTSRKAQFQAAKAVRTDPQKYAQRPHVPNSILKWRIPTKPKSSMKASVAAAAQTPTNSVRDPPPSFAPQEEVRDDAPPKDSLTEKKSVRWRDQQHTEDRTEIEQTAVELASKYCGIQGDGIADILSSPQGRAAQSFFGGNYKTPQTMAHMADNLFGTTNEENSSAGAAGNITTNKVFYDDQGHAIPNDDVSPSPSTDVGSYFPNSIPVHESESTASQKQQKNAGRSNLFCSNIPFMDTVMTGIGVASVVAASAATKAGVPEDCCWVYTTKQHHRSMQHHEISEELKQAQESLGIYEPENYDQPGHISAPEFKRQATPKCHRSSMRRAGTPRYAEEDDDRHDDHEQNRDHQTRDQTNSYRSSSRSYATSDITMGNTTINHFSGNASLFDTKEDETRNNSASTSHKNKSSFNSLVDELKHVQQIRRQNGGSGMSTSSSSKQTNTSSRIHTAPIVEGVVKSRLSEIKKDYEKHCKSPRASVATTSYLNSLKKSPVNSVRTATTNAPPTPNHDRAEAAKLLEKRGGSVANLAKQFESPRSAARPVVAMRSKSPAAYRKGVDPLETRFYDGKVDLLPPTPRCKAAEAAPVSPTGYSMTKGGNLRLHDWSTPTSRSIRTDAEIREAASTILDAHLTTARLPSLASSSRPRSLVRGPETVVDQEDLHDVVDDPVRDHSASASKEVNSKKSRKDKKKQSKRSKTKDRSSKNTFATKLKQSMKKVTQKVEHDRMANC